MTHTDWLYLGLFAAYLVADYWAFVPAFGRRVARDAAAARRWLWWTFLLMLGAMTLAGAGLWLYEQRAWQAIGLSLPAGWRAWTGGALVLAFALLEVRTVRKVARSTAHQERIRAQLQGLGSIRALMPRTVADLRLAIAGSTMAGIGEEFLFRGYLPWVLRHGLPTWAAALAALAIFAIGHAYQGRQGMRTSVILGALMTLLVMLFDSLLPAMAIHATIDIASSTMAWLALRNESERGPESPRAR